MSKSLLITMIVASEAEDFDTTQEQQRARREELSKLSRENLIELYRCICMEAANA